MLAKEEKEYLSSLLGNLVDIQSEFPEEKAIIEFLKEHFHSLEIKTKEYPLAENRINLLASLGKSHPVLCLNAHVDTVKATKKSMAKSSLKDNRLYGLGACDDKASLVAMIGVLKHIKEQNILLDGELDLLASVDEENMGLGAHGTIDKGYHCDLAIVGEPTSLELIIAHSGILFLQLFIPGVSTHGSSPWKGINAIEKMQAMIDQLEKKVRKRKTHPLVGKPSLNLGYIQGGMAANIVPAECEAKIDIRVMPNDSVDEVLQIAQELVKREGGSLKILRKNYPMQTPPEAKLVRTMQEIIAIPEVRGWRGWAESAPFRNRLQAETVVFGPGNLEQAHSDEEYVELEQVYTAYKIYRDTALKLLT